MRTTAKKICKNGRIDKNLANEIIYFMVLLSLYFLGYGISGAY
jgi:hypothetical protein